MSSAATDIPGEQSGLVARLSLEEKVRLLTGADAWVASRRERDRTAPDGPFRRAGGGAGNPFRSH